MTKRSENSLSIYKKLYFADGETKPEQVHDRVARFLATNDDDYNDYLYVQNENIFRGNTPIYINSGIESNNIWDKQLCACHVCSLDDSMESIIDLWDTCSKIYASGAGAGMPITNLREKGAPIANGKGIASGPLEYIKVQEVISKTVRSGGRARRSANLATMWYKHPQIMELIRCKTDYDLSSFNVSIMLDDSFLSQIESGKDFVVSLISPKNDKKVGEMNGKELWNSVIENAWRTGDPGIFYYTTANRFNPFPSYSDIHCGNPCLEVPLPPNFICCLGSINLNKIYNNGEVDWQKFGDYIKIATRFLNNVIDRTAYVSLKFENTMKRFRPIGIGLMGWSDLLFKLKIPYNSNGSIELFESICKYITIVAIEESIELAKKYGSIEILNDDKEHFENLLRHYTNDDLQILNKFNKYGIRNCVLTSIAPTGSISISADCSYSFEPAMAICYQKTLSESGDVMNFVNPIFEEWLDKYCGNTDNNKKKILQKIVENHGSVQGISEIPEDIQNIFVCAHDISPEDKIKMQGTGQKYIMLGISSTCNLPNSATKEDVEKAYLLGWKAGLKGMTVFRDGCLGGVQPISFGKKECIEVKPENYKRPITRSGKTIEVKSPEGSLYVTINKDDSTGKPIEVFLRMGKQGNKINLLIDALSRCISKALQGANTLPEFASTLRGNKDDSPFYFRLSEDQEKPFQAESIVDAVGIILDSFSNDTYIKLTDDQGNLYELCPACGKFTLSRALGCRNGACVNPECGYSSCG